MRDGKSSERVESLRGTWDGRARADARYYIKCDLDDDSLEGFLRSGREDVERFVDPLLEELGSRHLAVDIGCGVGRLSRPLAERFDEVVGLDISPEMVDRARALEPPAPENIEFRVVDGDGSLPFDDRSVDFVFSYIVFQHLPDGAIVERYMREIARVLTVGGVAKVQVNTRRRSFRERLRLGIVASEKVPLLRRKPKLKLDPHDPMGVVLSERECRRIAARCGLRTLDLGPLGEQYTWWTVAPRDASR